MYAIIFVSLLLTHFFDFFRTKYFVKIFVVPFFDFFRKWLFLIGDPFIFVVPH